MYNFGTCKIFVQNICFFWSGPVSRSPDGSGKDGGGRNWYTKNIMLTWNVQRFGTCSTMFHGFLTFGAILIEWNGRNAGVNRWKSIICKGCQGSLGALRGGWCDPEKFFFAYFSEWASYITLVWSWKRAEMVVFGADRGKVLKVLIFRKFGQKVLKIIH